MSSVLKTMKMMLRPFSVLIRRRIKWDRLMDIYTYIQGVNSAHRPFPGGMLPVNNSSNGFLERIIELADPIRNRGRWLLVSEPASAPDEIRDAWKKKHQLELPAIDSIEVVLKSKWSPQEFHYDLCRYPIMENPPKYQVVLHQSLLEHVVDPVSVIRNLNEFLVPGGIQVIQTVNIYCSLHRYPIDCLRYFPDFFSNLNRYIDVDCIETFMENGSIYAILQNNSR